MFYFVNERYAYLTIGSLIFNSVVNTVVTLAIPEDEWGAYFGVINCFCVIGQQMSNFGIRYLVTYLFKEDIPRYLISIPAFIEMIFDVFMKMPQLIRQNYS